MNCIIRLNQKDNTKSKLLILINQKMHIEIPKEYLNTINFEITGTGSTHFYNAFINDQYCGDVGTLEIYQQELLKGDLDFLPLTIASILVEIGQVYDEEFIDKRAEFFAIYLPITKALAFYKSFVEIEFRDVINMLNDEILADDFIEEERERRISQEVKDAVWRRAKGKCENCGS